ncbi:hypothetical protein MCOR04_007600 [Pyricularia oryzae]|nr:hypothetical protein MCOR04_007600 [Pyricularia oryzae]
MTVKHIVLFQFKADARPEAIQEVCSNMVALKDNCLHPASQMPYIKSMSGGKDNSPENLQICFFGPHVRLDSDGFW